MADPQTATAFPRLNIDTAELVSEVEKLIEEARQIPEKMGAVNWGDIGVRDVEYRISMLHSDYGPSGVVLVEEADPGCKLARWLNDHLDKKRFPNVDIECEW